MVRMSLAEPDPPELPPAPRRRGRPPRIGVPQIVAVTREIPAHEVTVQAVADALGVDRKAVHYHVRGREELLELVAAELVGENVRRIDISGDDDWRDVLRGFAIGMRDAIVDTASYAHYLDMATLFLAAIDVVELTLGVLLQAGFSELEAGHALNFVGEFVSESAALEVAARQRGENPHLAEVQTQIQHVAVTTRPALQRVVMAAGSAEAWGDTLRDFDIEVTILGLDALLRAKGVSSPEPPPR
jgi:AcrR family transcriptional regulator